MTLKRRWNVFVGHPHALAIGSMLRRGIKRRFASLFASAMTCTICLLGSSAVRADQSPSDPYDLHLTMSAEEQAYIASLPVLRLGVPPTAAPFAFVDKQGDFRGITADYLAYVQHTLHIQFELAPAKNWHDTLALAKAGRLDLVAGVDDNGQLGDGFVFSQPFVEYPAVIVTRDDAPYVGGLPDLKGARVILTEGAELDATQGVPDMRITYAASPGDGLNLVANGTSFAYIGNLDVVERIIKSHYAGILRVAAPTGYSQTLHFATSSDYARLTPIIDRVLRSIPPSEQEHIQSTWLSTRLQYMLPTRTIWHVIAPIALIVVIFIGILGVIIRRLRREVEQRHWTESELRFQSQFQQMLMNTVPIPIFVRDLQNRYLEVNPAYERTLGISAANVVGKTAVEAKAVSPDDGARLDQLTREVLLTGLPREGQTEYRDLNGDRREAVYWLRLCYGDDQQPRALIGASVDVTELRTVERREIELRRRLEELTRVIPAVTFQCRVSSTGSVTLIFLSDYAKVLIGPQAATLLEDPSDFSNLIKHRDWRSASVAIARAIREGSTNRTVFRLHREDGSVAWVRLEAVSRQDENGDHIVSGYLIDVTQSRQQASSLAAAKREAEEASQFKDIFLATMSHEIRTPMSGVIGVLDLMNHADLAIDTRHLLDMARGAANTLMRVVNDILDFSRNRQGELTLETLPFSLREVVDGVSGLFTPEMHKKGLRFDIVVSGDAALQHVGDAHRIGQVLLNLVGNALKFTDHGSVVLRIEVDTANTPVQSVRVIVRDTGVGISASQQERLFTPFAQADSSTSRRFGGSGLGLAICRQLVDAMGGTIALKSAPGHGTQVTVTLQLPVLTSPTAALPNCQAWVSIGDSVTKEAVIEHLRALGVPPFAPSADHVDSRALPVVVFRDTQLALPATEQSIFVFDVTRDVGAISTEQSGSAKLSVNPLRWGDISRAVHAINHDLVEGADFPEEHTNSESATEDLPKILLVEDQPLNQELLLRQMMAVGASHCDLCSNGAEALEALALRDYALIITDCAMPVMGGVELIRRIRRAESLGAPRAHVVALTANATDQQREECLNAGADDVLIKPVGTETLRRVLDSLQVGKPTPPQTVSHALPLGITEEEWPELLARLNEGFNTDRAILKEAIQAKRLGQAKEAAHRILGAARWFRLETIAALAATLEDKLEGSAPLDGEWHALALALDAFQATNPKPD